MLVDPLKLREVAGISPKRILHVGAHHMEELQSYQSVWPQAKRVWIEADPHSVGVCQAIMERTVSAGLTEPHQDCVVQGAAWHQARRTLSFNVASNGQSSSVLEPVKHLQAYPDVEFGSTISVETVRIDELCKGLGFEPDFLNLDIQGAELRALEGASGVLPGVESIYCEVNATELYAGVPLVAEIDGFLAQYGFSRVVTVWTRHGWGDALYSRRRHTVRHLATTLTGYAELGSSSVRHRLSSWLRH